MWSHAYSSWKLVIAKSGFGPTATKKVSCASEKWAGKIRPWLTTRRVISLTTKTKVETKVMTAMMTDRDLTVMLRFLSRIGLAILHGTTQATIWMARAVITPIRHLSLASLKRSSLENLKRMMKVAISSCIHPETHHRPRKKGVRPNHGKVVEWTLLSDSHRKVGRVNESWTRVSSLRLTKCLNGTGLEDFHRHRMSRWRWRLWLEKHRETMKSV